MASLFGEFNPKYRAGRRPTQVEERVIRELPPPPAWMIKPAKPPVVKKKKP